MSRPKPQLSTAIGVLYSISAFTISYKIVILLFYKFLLCFFAQCKNTVLALQRGLFLIVLKDEGKTGKQEK